MNQLEMPSKVTNKKYIFMPQTEKVIESDEEWSRCGKWLVPIRNADMELLDKAWKDLQPLLADGTLIWLKASTAMMKQMKDEGAELHCFTGPGLEEIRRAASAIRQVVDLRGCMYYKTNKKTEEGISHRTGHKQIATHMHTYLGRFYKKDANRWIPVDEDDRENFSLSREFDRQNYSDPDPLLSKPPISMGNTINPTSNWYLYCSCLEEDDLLPPEIDRVWAVATRLLSEGRVTGLWTRNYGSYGEVRLFVDGDSDISQSISSCIEHLEPHLELCDRIFREASVRGIMYYRTGEDGATVEDGATGEDGLTRNLHHCIKYMSDGELYKATKSGDVFIKSIPSHIP